MAGNGADFSDDESFGDFKVASYPENSALNYRPENQISASDYDEWGEFVDNSTQMNGGFELSNGLANTQSLSKLSDSVKLFDPFGISVDRKQQHESHVPDVSRFSSAPTPSSTKSMENRLPKRRGALPLSIFGEDEDRYEEQIPVASEATFGGDVNLFSNKNVGSDNKRSGLNNGIGINDLIANLYDQSAKGKAENGSGMISSGLKVNTFASKSDANGTILNSSFQDSRVNGLGLDSEPAVKDGDDDEDDGWEFKSAQTEILQQNGTSQRVAQGSGHDALGSVHAPSKSCDFSNWISHRADDWNLGFESIPRARSQDNLTSDSNAESKSKQAGGGTAQVNGNFWGLNDAFAEPRSRNISEPSVLPDVLYSSVEATKVESKGPYGLNNPSPESNKISATSQGLDFGFDFDASLKGLDGNALDSIKTDQDDIVKGVGCSPIHENGNSDATFGIPKNGMAGTGQKLEGNETNLNTLNEALPESHFGIAKPQTNSSIECQDASIYNATFNTSSKQTVGSKLSVNDLISTLYNQAEERTSVNHTPTFNNGERDGLPTVLDPHLVNGDNEFVEDSWEFQDASSGVALFSQAEQSNAATDKPKPTDIGLQSSMWDYNFNNSYNMNWELMDAFSGTGSKSSSQVQQDVLNSLMEATGPDLLVSFEDDFGDDSWEFKDASLATLSNDRTSDINLNIPPSDVSIKLELSDYKNLCSKLTEELYYTCLNHLENLKKAQNIAAHPSGDREANVLGEEIEEFSHELRQCEKICTECRMADQAPRRLHLNQLVEILKEPKYQLVDSEYQLSPRLSIADKDLRAAIELLKHVASTGRILNLKSREEQSDYLAMWSRIVYVCSRELKLGAHIWKQSLVKHVNDLILSTHQGKQHIHALGEIFRVVEIIGASAKLYKPWVLVGSVDCAETRSLFTSLNECSVIWSSSGLEDALKSVLLSLDQERTQTELLQSIKYIHDLDEPALQKHLNSRIVPKCRISSLPLDLVPGLKAVEWEGQNYFLTLANLWANLISPNPPKS